MKKIKEKLNNLTDKQRKILYYLVVGIIIVGLIAGLSFAWFSATVSGNETAKSDVVETANLSIKYTNSNEIKGENIMPGWSQTKTFTVENTGDATAKYTIYWANLTNEFVNKDALTYKITSTNSGGSLVETSIPNTGTDINIIKDIEIPAGVIQTYSLTVYYKEINRNQNADQGKTLIGKIEVSEIAKPTAATTLISKSPTTTGTINTDGLMKVSQPATGQTPAQTEYRYSGSNVKNYVTFNGEPWRIIGVFSVDDGTGNYEQRVKIMRNDSIGDYSWDSSASTVNGGYGINEWSQADLKTELNTTYYNRTSGTCYNGDSNASTACDFSSTGLTETARNMIDDAKWYTSSYSPEDATSSTAYTAERASTTTQCGSFSSLDCSGESVTRTTNWTGKIALAYPSDYGYASSGCYTGTQTLYEYNDSTCKNSNWMFNGFYQWLLSTHSNYARYAQYATSNGRVTYYFAYYTSAVRPVTYLKSNIVITGGSGTSSDPYTLGL